MGVKGSWKRPSSVPEWERELRYGYAFRPKGEEHMDWDEWVAYKGKQRDKDNEGQAPIVVG